jgi:hypothetical protein
MERSMDEFLHHANVEKYKHLLRETRDARQRAMLTSLLIEEAARAKAAGWLPLYD